MNAFDDGLWARLVEDYDAHLVSLDHDAQKPHRRPLLVGGGIATIAAAAAAAVLIIEASTAAPPAYALTQNDNGTVTVTINDIATAIPALNARFAQMGIDETVIPATSSCTNTTLIPLTITPGETTSDTVTFGPGRKYLAPGNDGFIAAEQLPDGQVAMVMGAMMPPLPSCFSSTPYIEQVTGDTTGTPTISITPATSTTAATTTTTPGK